MNEPRSQAWKAAVALVHQYEAGKAGVWPDPKAAADELVSTLRTVMSFSREKTDDVYLIVYAGGETVAEVAGCAKLFGPFPNRKQAKAMGESVRDALVAWQAGEGYKSYEGYAANLLYEVVESTEGYVIPDGQCDDLDVPYGTVGFDTYQMCKDLDDEYESPKDQPVQCIT